MGNFKIEKKYLYWGLTAFLVIIACIAFYSIIQHWSGIRAAVKSLFKILSPFIWGAALAYLLTPIVRVFQEELFQPLGMRINRGDVTKARKFGRGMAITFAIILMIALISVLIYLIIPQLYESLESLVTNISGSIEKLQKWADRWLENYPILETNFSDVLDDISGSFTKWVKETLLPQMTTIISSVSTGVINVVKALANIVIATAVSIYIMYSREKFTAQAKKIMYSIFTPRYSRKILNVLRFTDRAFMGFFSGKLLDSLLIGIICYIACLIIGIKDSVLIAVIVGITNIIPVFGPFIGTVPSALIVLMYSPIKCLIFVIFIIVLQQFDGNFLGPKILGSKTGLSGFWVLFSIIVGAGLFGPIGMIIGVPLFVVFAAGIKSLVNNKLKRHGLPVNIDIYDGLDYIDPETNKPVKKTYAGNANIAAGKILTEKEKEDKSAEDK
ncbi:MAG: AI-2E family transporter [Clostridiales bacterium]|nr:AI-2E family transporter [Clostridiales bacterium]